jgi:hypothetical protein
MFIFAFYDYVGVPISPSQTAHKISNKAETRPLDQSSTNRTKTGPTAPGW